MLTTTWGKASSFSLSMVSCYSFQCLFPPFVILPFTINLICAVLVSLARYSASLLVGAPRLMLHLIQPKMSEPLDCSLNSDFTRFEHSLAILRGFGMQYTVPPNSGRRAQYYWWSLPSSHVHQGPDYKLQIVFMWVDIFWCYRASSRMPTAT